MILDCINEINEARLKAVPDQFADISFGNGKNELDITPTFKRVTYYPKGPARETQTRPVSAEMIAKGSLHPDWIQSMIASAESVKKATPVFAKPITETLYESRVPILFQLNNSGATALENIHVILSLPKDKNVKFFEDNKESEIPLIIPKNRIGSIFVNDDDQKECRIFLSILNPESLYHFDPVFLLAPYEADEIEISWVIKSKTYSNSGILTVKSQPEYEEIGGESNEKAYTTEYIEKITRR